MEILIFVGFGVLLFLIIGLRTEISNIVKQNQEILNEILRQKKESSADIKNPVTCSTEIEQESEPVGEIVKSDAWQLPSFPPLPYTVSDIETAVKEESVVSEDLRIEPSEEKHRNIEKLVGENLFSKIGILVLITGIGFFVKYAIDNNWINEISRTFIGLLAGAGLGMIAYGLRNKYHAFSSVLAGGGFAACFVTIAIAYNFYELFSALAAFAILVLMTATIIMVSLKSDRRELAVMGVLGGFIAPFLAVGDSGNIVTLMSYVLVLDVAMFAITMRKNWWELSVVGCVSTWIIAAVSCITIDDSIIDNALMLGFSTLFVTLFSFPLTTVLNSDKNRGTLFKFLLASAVVNDFVYLALGLHFIDKLPVLGHFRGLIPIVIISINAGVYFRFYRKKVGRFVHELLLWMVIVFAFLFVPIQFSNLGVMGVCLSVYVLLLAVAYSLTRKHTFRSALIIIGLITFLYVFIIRNGLIYGLDISILYTQGWTYGLSGICFIASSVFIGMRRYSAIRNQLDRFVYSMLMWSGVLMVVFSCYYFAWALWGLDAAVSAFITSAMLSMLVADIYALRKGFISVAYPAIGCIIYICAGSMYMSGNIAGEILFWLGAAFFGTLLFTVIAETIREKKSKTVAYKVYLSLSVSVFVVASIAFALRSVNLSQYYSAGFSVGFTLCGATLVAAGMRFQQRAVRLVGLCLFGCVLLKLVCYDLWQLPIIGRIVVFVLLGGVLLAVSFLYQKLRKRLF